MDATPNVRIDKWLWAVRIYKTRTLAAEACRRGAVEVDGQRVKPSHQVRLGEVIKAKTEAILKTVKVQGLLEHRVGASVVKEYLDDLTPPEEYQKPKEPYFRPLFYREKGRGRPTKKERRDLDQLEI